MTMDLVEGPQHTVDLNRLPLGQSLQTPVAGQEDASGCSFSQRDRHTVVEAQGRMSTLQLNRPVDPFARQSDHLEPDAAERTFFIRRQAQ